MWSNPQISADLVTFTEEIFNGKLHFLCSVSLKSFGNSSGNSYSKFAIRFSWDESKELSNSLLEPDMWLLVNHTKPTNTLYWNSGQLKYNTVSGEYRFQSILWLNI